MTRVRLTLLLVVVAALALAVAYSLRSPSAASKPAAVDLAPLRAQAALAACPAGISPDLPDLTLPCLGGGPPAPLRGTPAGIPVLVNVYGSWCGPCQREMPILKQFHDAASGRVGLVGIDSEDDRRQALHFAIDVQQHWAALADDDGVVLRAFGAGAPKMLFVDARGKVVHVERGGYRSLGQLRADTARYLGVSV